jgi:FdhD protein
LDKIYGTVLEQKITLNDKLIVFSGRISSEVLLKVSKIGVGILLSKSAPTDLALNLANELGITAIGFARENKMNVYTHPHRIVELDMESYTK